MKNLGFMMSLMLGLFVSVCALTACSSDDDDDVSIYGTWCYDYFNDGETVYVETTFKENGTCTEYSYNSDKSYESTMNGTFKVDGNKLSIWWEGSNEPDVSTFEIKGNKAYIDGGAIVVTKK